MNSLKDKIKSLAQQFSAEAIEIRRHLHKYPELSMRETQTSLFLSQKLTEYGIEHQTGIAKTGIVGLIKGQNSEKKIIALRADMDALPIAEQNNNEYYSVNQGIMHACGHDAHMTNLLMAAKILHSLRNEFEGSVKLIFQPSEEQFPGGASMMIAEGVLENPKPQHILGQHVLPTLEAGKIGLKPGQYMASTDEIYLTVKGKGGHAATPELNIDPVVIASHIVVALQQIVSRYGKANIPTVLSFGRMIADGRTNIIPDTVKLDGTLRTFDETWRAEAHKRIESIAKGIAQGMGGDCEVFIDKGYPFLVNDDVLTQRTKEKAIEYLGKENVVDLDLRMTAEDFAYFSQQVPSCFYRLGSMNPETNVVTNLHTSTFDIDETSLTTGMGLMAWLAIEELKYQV